ncbi:phage tail tip lysozyme [Haliscomenobacter sp.]|uniref:phage tail tip lysozyme n=1 Tax=Haliscomenobacter sp. TaxID=2717303 RepID=UPI003364EA24
MKSCDFLPRSSRILAEAVDPAVPGKMYPVQAGDTLEKLAQAADTTVSGLLYMNPDIPATGQITVGSKLKLPNLGEFAGTQTTAPAVGPSTKIKNPVNPNEIKSYLSSKGLDRNQVAGIMANIQAESSFDSGAIGDSGTSGGLVQHHGPRFNGMVQAAGGQDQWQKNWKAQLDYALSEPAGARYKNMTFPTPQAATSWWTINFEIPANKEQQAAIRSQSASQFA